MKETKGRTIEVDEYEILYAWNVSSKGYSLTPDYP